jgi:hypothetical protein
MSSQHGELPSEIFDLDGSVVAPHLLTSLAEVVIGDGPATVIAASGAVGDDRLSRIREFSQPAVPVAEMLATITARPFAHPPRIVITAHTTGAFLIMDREGGAISVRADWLDRARDERAVRAPTADIPPPPLASCAITAAVSLALVTAPPDAGRPELFLAALLTAADEEAADVLALLGNECGKVPASLLTRAAAVAYAGALTSAGGALAALAERRAGDTVTSAFFLPLLQSVGSRTDCDRVRDRIALAHHRIGKAALGTTDPRALAPLRRSTYRGRYRHLDVLLVNILRAAVAARGRRPAPESEYGVDIAALAASLPAHGPVRIADDAVSDATTTLDLRDALGPIGMPVEISAGDINMDFGLVTAGEVMGVVDDEGRCVQICGSAVPGWPWRGLRADHDRQQALRVEQAATMPGSVTAMRWLHPMAAQETMRSGHVQLSFVRRDVFQLRRPWANVTRAVGVLYRQLRNEVDASSYFDDESVLSGVRAVGRGLLPGGVALVGSVVGAADGSRTYTDADILQRSAAGECLHHVARIGLGLGPALGSSPIAL